MRQLHRTSGVPERVWKYLTIAGFLVGFLSADWIGVFRPLMGVDRERVVEGTSRDSGSSTSANTAEPGPEEKRPLDSTKGSDDPLRARPQDASRPQHEPRGRSPKTDRAAKGHGPETGHSRTLDETCTPSPLPREVLERASKLLERTRSEIEVVRAGEGSRAVEASIERSFRSIHGLLEELPPDDPLRAQLSRSSRLLEVTFMKVRGF